MSKAPAIVELEGIIRASLERFAQHVQDTGWFGKEREMVSYYALGFLAKECRVGSVLFDPGQISVEVRVPGIKDFTKKKQVCKDLLVWERPGMTCWNERRESVLAPLVIMEWKDELTKDFAYDVEWVRRFSEDRPDFLGITVALHLARQGAELRCCATRNGLVESNWLVIA